MTRTAEYAAAASAARNANIRAHQMGVRGHLTVGDILRLRHSQTACFACGSTTNLGVDHTISMADEGPNTPDNLRILCQSCNSKKGPPNRGRSWLRSLRLRPRPPMARPGGTVYLLFHEGARSRAGHGK